MKKEIMHVDTCVEVIQYSGFLEDIIQSHQIVRYAFLSNNDSQAVLMLFFPTSLLLHVFNFNKKVPSFCFAYLYYFHHFPFIFRETMFFHLSLN